MKQSPSVKIKINITQDTVDTEVGEAWFVIITYNSIYDKYWKEWDNQRSIRLVRSMASTLAKGRTNFLRLKNIQNRPW